MVPEPDKGHNGWQPPGVTESAWTENDGVGVQGASYAERAKSQPRPAAY